jgi:hypothetical protein
MEISVDYFTVRLHEEGGKFDFHNFAKWLEQERVNEETGERLAPVLMPNQFRVKTMQDKTVVVSFYGGAEPVGIALAKKYDLPITRIDLALDKVFETPEDCEAEYNQIIGDLRTWVDEQGTKPTFFQFEGRQTNKNGEFGSVLFSRSSPKQLSVYAKRDLKAPGEPARKLRYEWRLHSHVAKEIWPLVAARYPLNKSTLYDLHQNLTEKFIDQDFFNLGAYNGKNLKLTKNPNPEDNFLNWATYIVPKALFRHFKLTGVDLTLAIKDEFLRLVLADSEDTERRTKNKNQSSIAATYHQLRKKLTSISEVAESEEEE